MKRIYEIHDLQAYINWAYFYHAWQLHSTELQQQSRAEAEQVLHQLDGRYRAYAIFQLFDANSDGDDIVLLQKFPCFDSNHETANICVFLISSVPSLQENQIK